MERGKCLYCLRNRRVKDYLGDLTCEGCIDSFSKEEEDSKTLETKYLEACEEIKRLREALDKALWCMAYTNGDNGSKDWSEHDSRICDCRAIAKQALETGVDDGEG